MRPIVLLIAVLILNFSFTEFAFARCPDTSQKETKHDCPWAELTRSMLKLQGDQEKIQAFISDSIPNLAQELKEINSVPGHAIANLWGQSKNTDANAGGVIVPEDILEALARISEVSIQYGGGVVHSGMVHSFGYLFSNLNTPFGYKRWRWTKPEVGKELGLESNVWAPEAREGNFFANVSYIMWKIALRNNEEALDWKPDMLGLVADSLKTRFDPKNYQHVRITERFTTARARNIMLQTDLIAFLDQDGIENDALLIYSLKDSKGSDRLQLITAFPVAKGFYDSFLNLPTGKVDGLKAKYNAYINGLDQEKYSGIRSRDIIFQSP